MRSRRDRFVSSDLGWTVRASGAIGDNFNTSITYESRPSLNILDKMYLLQPLAIFSILSRTSIAAGPSYLQLTALISDDDGVARFECWEMSTPFSDYPTVGAAIPGLAQVDNVSYVTLPSRSNEGLHNPPFPM